MVDAEKKIKETKALDSPTFIVEDIPNEPTKQEYLTDGDVKKIALKVEKDALFIEALY